jgi:hypothetical protein
MPAREGRVLGCLQGAGTPQALVLIPKHAYELKDRAEPLKPVDDIPDAILPLVHEDRWDRDSQEQRLDEARLLSIAPAKEALELGVDVEIPVAIHIEQSPTDIG